MTNVRSFFYLSGFDATEKDLEFYTAGRQCSEKLFTRATFYWLTVDCVAAELVDHRLDILISQRDSFPVVSELVSHLSEDLHIFVLLVRC